MFGRVVFEAICAPPPDHEINWHSREWCPISDVQFRVAAAAQISVESVQEQVKSLLEDRIVVGFALEGDLKVLGISLPPEKTRDIQKHFNAKRCSESDLVGRGLPELHSGRPVHSLRNLAGCILGRPIQEGAHSALVDAQATMDLYIYDRAHIEG